MKKQIVITLVSCLFLFSCKKGEAIENTCGLNDTNFAGTFKVKSVIYKYSATDPGTDYFLTWDACKKDDLLYIQSDHQTLHVDAGMRCSPSGGGIGNWTLSGNTIVMDYQAGTMTYFDCKTTIIVSPQPTPNETITTTLERQ